MGKGKGGMLQIRIHDFLNFRPFQAVGEGGNERETVMIEEDGIYLPIVLVLE